MKKLVTMFLALALCMGLAVPGFAADGYEEVTFEMYGSSDVVGQITLPEGKAVLTSYGTVDHYDIPEDGTIIFTPYAYGSSKDPTIICLSCYDRDADGNPTEKTYLQLTTSGQAVKADPNSLSETAEYQFTPNQAYTLTLPQETSYVSLFCYNDSWAEGFWLYGGSVEFHFAGSASQQPTTPVEPEQPSEPTTPSESEQPSEPTTPSEPEQPREPPTPAEPERPAGTVTYTVKKGDTLGFITTNYYGSNAQRNALYKANAEAFKATSGKLVEGMTLVIPETLGGVKRIAAPVLAEGESLYTVQAGDTLSKIAQSVYGDMWQYKAIFERNSDRLKNANTIYEGQVIVLPAK